MHAPTLPSSACLSNSPCELSSSCYSPWTFAFTHYTSAGVHFKPHNTTLHTTHTLTIHTQLRSNWTSFTNRHAAATLQPALLHSVLRSDTRHHDCRWLCLHTCMADYILRLNSRSPYLVQLEHRCKAEWLLYVPPGLTFTNSTFCPHSMYMCFVWISEQTVIISLHSINWLVFITEAECVYCAVRTAFFKRIRKVTKSNY
jgi:hypothetical protein